MLPVKSDGAATDRTSESLPESQPQLQKDDTLRILLIATNRQQRLLSRTEAIPLPIGLAYVAAHLDPSRHTVRVLDLMFSEEPLETTSAAVKEFRPDLVGLSLRNLDNQSYLDPQWALPAAKDVIDTIRSVSTANIVCGGPAFGILPKECFRYLGPDFGLVGDGGETFGQIADRLDQGQSCLDLPGLVYSHGEDIVVGQTAASSSFLKSPRLEDLDMARYVKAGFGMGIVTKLGDFSQSTVSGDKWRIIRPPEDVVREVVEMKERFGMQKVFFIDSGFNIPTDHARSLCQMLIDADLNIIWNTPLAAVPEFCEPDLLSTMVQAGCSLVLMNGVRADEEGDGDLHSRLESLKSVCRHCEEAGLRYTISQYFGEIGETEETFETKLGLLRSLNPAVADLRVGVRILPGTPEAKAAIESGQLESEDQLLPPTFYIEESVKPWLADRLVTEVEKHARWNVI